MGFFDRLGGAFGSSAAEEQLDVDKLIQSSTDALDLDAVDAVSQEPKFYVIPHVQESDDVTQVIGFLDKGHIVVLDISRLANRPNTLKNVIDRLKEYTARVGGDMARISEEKVLVVPSMVKILRRKR
ncbi:MAG: cell division protein SepF [Candidatus Micrarchaeota archaeon]|nr:MAG: cell division protein SepF [Candidatus Micrarchaeota archaeon]